MCYWSQDLLYSVPVTGERRRWFSPILSSQICGDEWREAVYMSRTRGVVGEKIALIGLLMALPLLGGLILFSFCLRLQNHTRITSFSMLSWSAIMVTSSEVGFWFCLEKGKCTRNALTAKTNHKDLKGLSPWFFWGGNNSAEELSWDNIKGLNNDLWMYGSLKKELNVVGVPFLLM